MLITLQNECQRLTADTLGARMMSLRANGTEYLWQGDPRYWPDRAPTLFPFIGRLTDNSYRFRGKSIPWAFTDLPRHTNLPQRSRAMKSWCCPSAVAWIHCGSTHLTFL